MWPISLLILTACSNPPVAKSSGEATSPDTLLAQLSGEFIARIGDRIEDARREARYLDGRYVVLVDKTAPFLHLFTADGMPLWSGGRAGGGPGEFLKPEALATVGRMIYVIQRAHISRWALDRDTLAFQETIPLPTDFNPLGLIEGCGGDLLLYARSDREWSGDPPPLPGVKRVSHLFTLKLDDSLAMTQPWWGSERDPSITPYTGHAGVLIGRTDTIIAVLHRINAWTGGQILQFNCRGELQHSYSEQALATGEGVQVAYPRSRSLEWSAGIVAVPGGVLTAQQRYFSPPFQDVKEDQWKTEIFYLTKGNYTGPVVLHRQWVLQDYDQRLGVLMSTFEPVPHFIRVPLDVLLPSGTTR